MTPTTQLQTSTPVDDQLSDQPRPWWRDAVFYEVYIRSFADGDGDGVGDLAGIRSRLPYLRDLGIDAVWITPFYPSPMADGGYDVADYRGVDHAFGGLSDVDALLSEAHDLGLRVVVDLVPNHTSDQHPWFRAALAAGPGSPERERYLFRPGRGADGAQPPNDWVSVFGGAAWTRVPDGQWYLHLFAPEQPDLNWENEEVVREFESILRFWLDRGVDGFRVDVAHGLVKAPGLPNAGSQRTHADLLNAADSKDLPYWDQDGVHEIYRGWRRVLDSYDGQRMAVGEAWVDRPERLALYVRPDELQQAFNFDFLKADWSTKSLRRAVVASLEATEQVGATTTWVLSNHDVERHVTRYGGGDIGVRRARAAALLMLALPGSAYVYQGEELGLYEVDDLPTSVLADPIWERSGHTQRGRDGCRVPIPWSGTSEPYGFAPDGTRPWLPQPDGWAALSAEAQAGDPSSMLELYRTALHLRRDERSLGAGTLGWLDLGEDVVAFTRGPRFACVVNLGAIPVALPADARIILASQPVDDATLPADTAAWLRRP